MLKNVGCTLPLFCVRRFGSQWNVPYGPKIFSAAVFESIMAVRHHHATVRNIEMSVHVGVQGF